MDHKERKQYQKEYYKTHREKLKQYRLNHTVELKQYKKQYYETHKEEKKQSSKQYYETHKFERKQYRLTHKDEIKQYQLTHKEEIKQHNKQYLKTHKEHRKIKNNERRRFIRTDIILNQHFIESNLHHTKNGVAIYIPTSLHKSVGHCLKTGYNMDLINSKVDLWLTQNNIQVMSLL